MNQECAVKNAQYRTCSSQRSVSGTLLRGLRVRLAAFTLIEMLTVIAIIGVLAALLLPAIRMAQRKAKIALAKSNIATLSQALNTYNLTFGACPPDTNDGLSAPGVDFDDMDSPNECMVWFLTRTFSTDALTAAGAPWAAGAGWTPSTAGTVYSRVSHKGSLDVRAKQLRDDDGDGFYEFVDGWGRPYFYQARRLDWRTVTDVDDGDAGAGTACGVRFELNGVDGMVSFDADGERVGTVLGDVQLRGFDPSTYNGTFTFKGTADSWVEIEFAQDPGNVITRGEFRFHLHNQQTFDLYSLGPNGRTRGNVRPYVQPWNAQVQPEDWDQAWGNPGDGNDVASDEYGNIMQSDVDQDDVNNWSN